MTLKNIYQVFELDIFQNQDMLLQYKQLNSP